MMCSEYFGDCGNDCGVCSGGGGSDIGGGGGKEEKKCLPSKKPGISFLWYWIDVSPALVKMLISKETVDGNYIYFLLLFLMKPN